MYTVVGRLAEAPTVAKTEKVNGILQPLILAPVVLKSAAGQGKYKCPAIKSVANHPIGRANTSSRFSASDKSPVCQ